MYCLKCGKEAENNQVFCNHCLDIMNQYPVKPGTAIHLPKRESLPAQKKQNRRRQMTPEDQVAHLKVVVRTLLCILAAACIALGIFIGLYFMPDNTPQAPVPSIGQNYTVEPTDNP